MKIFVLLLQRVVEHLAGISFRERLGRPCGDKPLLRLRVILVSH